MTRPRVALRLTPVAGAAWGASLIAIMAPDAAPALAGALWVTVALALGSAVVRSRPGRGVRAGGHLLAILILTLSAAAVAASHVALASPARAAAASLPIAGGRAVSVVATVIGKVERRADGSLAFDAMASGIRAGSTSHGVDVPVLIQVAVSDVDDRSGLDVGAQIEARGTARPGRSGDRAVLEIRASRGVTVLRGPPGILAGTAALRHGLVTAVSGLPDPGAGLVPGLAVGDTSEVSAQLDAEMKQSSLSHLTAVSGANCAIVVGLAFAGAAALGARRGVRVVCGLLALCGFVLLVTPEPSVVRAAAMAAIAMLGVLLGRAGAGMALLSLATAFALAGDPWLASSLGFALSVTATASLLLFARPLAAGLGRRLPRSLSLALSVPLAAQLACGPLLVLISPAVPVFGVVANLLAAPAAPVATVVGLAACLAAPIPVLRDGLAAIAWLPASWIAATASTITALPGDLMPWIEGWPGAVLLGLVGGAIAVLIAVRAGERRPTRIARTSAAILVGVVVGVSGGGVALTSVAGPWTLPSGWSVLACDVGQGDAVLIRSAGAVLLVDTGPAPEPLAACLERTGIHHIDLLVLTHFDLDHVGGVDAVRGRIGTVLHGPPYGPAAAMLQDLETGGAQLVDAEKGMTGSLGAARWRVIWPRAESLAFPSGNDASVVVDIRGGGVPPTLLLGDLSAAPQRAIAASGELDPPYAIVKVAHHGSADQDAGLYAAAAPAVALVTVGRDNDYGHPRDETLAILDELGARVLRTDVDGIVAVSQRREGWELWRERGGVGAGG